MNDVRSPIDHIPVPLRWTAATRPARAQAAAGGAAAAKDAGQGDTRADSAVRAIPFTGLLRRKR